MSFATGLLLIDAPASALNNRGSLEETRNDMKVEVKSISSRVGAYPYISAQAFRYWLRMSLQKNSKWIAAPVFRDLTVAYTDADPIKWWDDDLFGYMRAPKKENTRSKSKDDKKEAESDSLRALETPLEEKVTLTRVSPFRVSTLVSLAPIKITEDFGVMSRHEGFSVPFEHQFYRTTLKGLFSLDMAACGTFSYRRKTGFLNLDKHRVAEAKERDLLHLEQEKAYQLPRDERINRIAALFEGLSQLEGGAKQALHYTDVMPPFLMLAVTRGGNHIFNHAVQPNSRNLPEVHIGALEEMLRVFKDEILSPLYIGWSQGYMDDQRDTVTKLLANAGVSYHIKHPREALQQFIADLRSDAGATWLR